MKKFLVEVISDDKGKHTVKVYKKTFFGKKFIQLAKDTRSQYALTKAFKGLLPRN